MSDPSATAPMPTPEDRWERTFPAPVVDGAAVAAWLAPWPEIVGRPWRVLAGGLRAVTVLVGDDRVLRVALTAEEDVAKHAAVLRAMARSVRTPAVVAVAPPALLLEHVAHAPLRDTEADGRLVGRAAARIHATSFPRSGFLDASLSVPAPFETALDGLLDWAQACLDGHAGRRLGPRADRVEAAWERAERRLRAACARNALVHGDFKPTNVRRAEGGDDVVVFDAEFAWAGPALMDLGQMLRWGCSDAFVEGLVDGYLDAGGTLEPRWRETAALLDLFHLVGLLDHETPMPVRDADVLARVDATLAAARG
ncbi:MAG: aminoglycoside phosphotransferase family protein [Planctomycetes bacterium]|nr:aminoglycoside phosphotransferase family protein [Planctomycetota bacterium]